MSIYNIKSDCIVSIKVNYRGNYSPNILISWELNIHFYDKCLDCINACLMMLLLRRRKVSDRTDMTNAKTVKGVNSVPSGNV